MADIDYPGGYARDVYTQGYGGQETGGQGMHPTQQQPEAPEPSSFGGTVRVLGALASMALVVGVGVWGYKLMIRDVSGVPVVRALEGPMRLQPDSPGGQQADHQGLAVNAVAAAGTAAPTADRLMLAPRPVELTAEDTPISANTSQSEQAQMAGIAGDSPDDLNAMTVEALVEHLTAGVAPLDGVTAAESDPGDAAPGDAAARAVQPEVLGADTPKVADSQLADQSSETPVQPAVLSGPGLTRSLRPVARPARAVVSRDADSGERDETADKLLASAINAAVDTVASLEVDPDSLPAGTRLAQLGAYDSIEIARVEWDGLSLKFEEYLDGKKRVIQKASSGGRTFYRLRAMGFDDLSAARRFCSALVSENTDCIPVTIR